MRHLTFIHFLCSSCIKDEPKNMECDVVEAWVEGDGLAQYFIRESDMRISDVPSGEERLTFIVRDLNTLPAMPVQFTLTPGATVSPANGSSQDFTNGPVTYTVTSRTASGTVPILWTSARPRCPATNTTSRTSN